MLILGVFTKYFLTHYTIIFIILRQSICCHNSYFYLNHLFNPRFTDKWVANQPQHFARFAATPIFYPYFPFS